MKSFLKPTLALLIAGTAVTHAAYKPSAFCTEQLASRTNTYPSVACLALTLRTEIPLPAVEMMPRNCMNSAANAGDLISAASIARELYYHDSNSPEYLDNMNRYINLAAGKNDFISASLIALMLHKIENKTVAYPVTSQTAFDYLHKAAAAVIKAEK